MRGKDLLPVPDLSLVPPKPASSQPPHVDTRVASRVNILLLFAPSNGRVTRAVDSLVVYPLHNLILLSFAAASSAPSWPGFPIPPPSSKKAKTTATRAGTRRRAFVEMEPRSNARPPNVQNAPANLRTASANHTPMHFMAELAHILSVPPTPRTPDNILTTTCRTQRTESDPQFSKTNTPPAASLHRRVARTLDDEQAPRPIAQDGKSPAARASGLQKFAYLPLTAAGRCNIRGASFAQRRNAR